MLKAYIHSNQSDLGFIPVPIYCVIQQGTPRPSAKGAGEGGGDAIYNNFYVLDIFYCKKISSTYSIYLYSTIGPKGGYVTPPPHSLSVPPKQAVTTYVTRSESCLAEKIV